MLLPLHGARIAHIKRRFKLRDRKKLLLIDKVPDNLAVIGR